MKIYIVTDLLSAQKWVYTSVVAMLMHYENPLEISSEDYFEIEKTKGYPLEHSGCRIDCIEALSLEDVREDNPACV